LTPPLSLREGKPLRVKIKRSIAGIEFSYYPGQVVDIDDDLARKWQESGIAESTKPESTAIEPPEKAVIPTPKKKKVR
jgi:hypothetical protein